MNAAPLTLVPWPLWVPVVVMVAVSAIVPTREPAAAEGPLDPDLVSKAIWRTALAACGTKGITHAAFAKCVDTTPAIVDACLSDARVNAPPHKWLVHPGCPPEVVAYVLAQTAYRASRTPRSDRSLEQVLQYVATRVTQFLTAFAASVSPGAVWRPGRENAAQLLRLLGDVILGAREAEPLLHRRIHTGGQPAATSNSSDGRSPR